MQNAYKMVGEIKKTQIKQAIKKYRDLRGINKLKHLVRSKITGIEAQKTFKKCLKLRETYTPPQLTGDLYLAATLGGGYFLATNNYGFPENKYGWTRNMCVINLEKCDIISFVSYEFLNVSNKGISSTVWLCHPSKRHYLEKRMM